MVGTNSSIIHELWLITGKVIRPGTSHPREIFPSSRDTRIPQFLPNIEGPSRIAQTPSPDARARAQAMRPGRLDSWLLEELNLEYSVVYYDREPSMAALITFQEVYGSNIGKAPVLIDGEENTDTKVDLAID